MSETAPAPEVWYMICDVGREDVTNWLPSGAAPGARAIIGRGDTDGTGTLTVWASGGDRFGSPGFSTEALVITAPMRRCTFEYQRVPVKEGSRKTAGFWCPVAEEP